MHTHRQPTKSTKSPPETFWIASIVVVGRGYGKSLVCLGRVVFSTDDEFTFDFAALARRFGRLIWGWGAPESVAPLVWELPSCLEWVESQKLRRHHVGFGGLWSVCLLFWFCASGFLATGGRGNCCVIDSPILDSGKLRASGLEKIGSGCMVVRIKF